MARRARPSIVATRGIARGSAHFRPPNRRNRTAALTTIDRIARDVSNSLLQRIPVFVDNGRPPYALRQEHGTGVVVVSRASLYGPVRRGLSLSDYARGSVGRSCDGGGRDITLLWRVADKTRGDLGPRRPSWEWERCSIE